MFWFPILGFIFTDQFLMDWIAVFLCSVVSLSHLPRDFLSQYKFSGSDSNMMEDKQMFI